MYDVILVDLPPHDNAGMEAALRAADIAVIPMQPAGLDVWTAGNMDDLAARAKEANPGLVALVVFTRASTNPRDGDVDEAKAALAELDAVRVSDVVIKERVAFKRSAPAGLTVEEYRPLDHRAIAEIRQLYYLVFGEGNERQP